jgi:hypothetical protein
MRKATDGRIFTAEDAEGAERNQERVRMNKNSASLDVLFSALSAPSAVELLSPLSFSRALKCPRR